VRPPCASVIAGDAEPLELRQTRSMTHHSRVRDGTGMKPSVPSRGISLSLHTMSHVAEALPRLWLRTIIVGLLLLSVAGCDKGETITLLDRRSYVLREV
jgi:hypothetical protein